MLTATKAALKSALALTSDIVERRNTIPILSNVLIERASNHEMQVRMTDLDIEARILFEGAADESFQPFTVPGGLLRDIVGKLPEGAEVSLTPSDDKLSGIRLKAGRSVFSLQVLPHTDFPDMTSGAFAAHFALPAQALARAISGVAFAISTEETRYYLNGIFMHAFEGGLVLVATDGHRLARRFLPDVVSGMPGVIVPTKTVKILAKLLASAAKEAEVHVEVSDAKIRFTLDGITLTSKLVDGTFPEYQRVIPESHTGRAELDGAALKTAVDRVSTVSSERGRACRFRFKDGTLSLEVVNPDAGSASEEMAYEGDADTEIGFNAKYVLEAVSSLPSGPLTLHLTDAGSPAILRIDGDHRHNLVVLMPMRA
jgi:DNA polymerase III subunit beta